MPTFDITIKGAKSYELQSDGGKLTRIIVTVDELTPHSITEIADPPEFRVGDLVTFYDNNLLKELCLARTPDGTWVNIDGGSQVHDSLVSRATIDPRTSGFRFLMRDGRPAPRPPLDESLRRPIGSRFD